MRRRLITVLTSLIFVVVSVMPLHSVHGSTFVVTNLNDNGPGSLREALTLASDYDTVTFQPGLSGTIYLNSRVNISGAVTLTGPGVNLIALDGKHTVDVNGDHSGTGILYILSQFDDVHISGLTFQNGYNYEKAAGILNDQGTLFIDHCVFRDNVTLSGGSAGAGGAAIFSRDNLNISDSTFANNASGAGDGMAIHTWGEPGSFIATTITRSAFIGNTADNGGHGAIANLRQGSITVNNSTFFNNQTSSGSGGAIASTWITQVSVTNSTFSNNGRGTFFGDPGASLIMGSTIVTGGYMFETYSNLGPMAFTSLGNNIVSDPGGSGGGWADSDQLYADPQLTSPADNGGPTPTQALLLASPAIAIGNCALSPAVTTDQRGVARKTPICDVGAYEAPYSPLVWNTRDYGGGSLRYAVSSATPGTTITFDPIAFNYPSTITLTHGGLTLPANLTLNGPGADILTVDGNGSGPVFTVPAGITASLSGLTITHGNAASGGGIDNAGLLTLSDCAVTANTANTGGGLWAHGGAATIRRCTFSGNTALTGYGGGIYASVPVLVSNSTITGNVSNPGGGGLFVNSSGALTIANSTVAGNSTGPHGGGIFNFNGLLTLGSTIVSGNTSNTDGPDILGAVTSLGYNLVYDPSGLTGLIAEDQSGINPLLQPLDNYGGHTQTMALHNLSQAIGRGNCGLGTPAEPVTTDQRGMLRKNSACDAGAFETVYSPVVSNANDFGWGSLRNAITGAPTGTTITFDPVFFSTPRTITLGGTPLDITENLIIQGPGAGLLAVDGDGASGVFTVSTRTVVTISGLTVQNGNAITGAGVHNSGRLTMEDCVIANNQSSSAGGGVYASAGMLTLRRCTLANNSAQNGGGLYNQAGGTQVNNTTFFGNTARYGGGLNNCADGTLTLSFSTISGNSVTYNALGSGGGGLYGNAGGTINLGNTIIAGNKSWDAFIPSASDINGTVASQGHNLIGSTNGAVGLVPSDLQKVAPLLDTALADNGGPTPTLALLVGSPAIEAADDAACPIQDQRGVVRPQNLHCDIGALEALTISGSTQVGGAVLSYPGGSVTTDAAGLYTIVVPLGWSGKIIPTKPGYLFNPPTRAYTNVLTSHFGQIFQAYRAVFLPMLKR